MCVQTLFTCTRVHVPVPLRTCYAYQHVGAHARAINTNTHTGGAYTKALFAYTNSYSLTQVQLAARRIFAYTCYNTNIHFRMRMRMHTYDCINIRTA